MCGDKIEGVEVHRWLVAQFHVHPEHARYFSGRWYVYFGATARYRDYTIDTSAWHPVNDAIIAKAVSEITARREEARAIGVGENQG